MAVVVVIVGRRGPGGRGGLVAVRVCNDRRLKCRII